MSRLFQPYGIPAARLSGPSAEDLPASQSRGLNRSRLSGLSASPNTAQDFLAVSGYWLTHQRLDQKQIAGINLSIQ